MSGDGKEVDDVAIPVVFLFSMEASELLKAITMANGDLTVTLGKILIRFYIYFYIFYYFKYISNISPILLFFLGNFFSKEDAQLKAPTDLSMFERLKGSLKSFLTRQMTPQVCIPWCFAVIFIEYILLWILIHMKRY